MATLAEAEAVMYRRNPIAEEIGSERQKQAGVLQIVIGQAILAKEFLVGRVQCVWVIEIVM